MVKLVEVQALLDEFRLSEVYVNPEHVVAMRRDDRMVQNLREGKLPNGLNESQNFTKLYIDRGQVGIDVTVVGDVEAVREKLGIGRRTLLKG